MDSFYKILPLLILLIVSILIIKVVIPIWYKIKLKKLTKFKPIIAIPDKNGFVIYSLNNEVKTIAWNEINKIDLVGKQKLQIHFNDKTILSLPEKEYSEWISLIKAIPISLKLNKALIAYKESYFENLSCCNICGKIAVKNDKCLNCASETYEKYSKDLESDEEEKPKTEREYIKENQLDWFSSFIEGAKVEFYFKDVSFDNCFTWTPVVTSSEVIKYEKEL